MKYLSEILSFYNRLQEQPMPAEVQALWHRLMAYANSFGWPKRFSVPDIKLAAELQVCRRTIYKHRKMLCERGFISYTPGKPGHTGEYEMHSLLSPTCSQTWVNFAHQIRYKTLDKETFHYGYYQNIELSKEQYIALCDEFADAKERIESLSEYLHKTGKTYANHYELLKNHRVRKEKPTEDDWNPFLKMLKEREKAEGTTATENGFLF